jgi:HPt (histidine-containing phosphotransfer) domain-containing protein
VVDRGVLERLATDLGDGDYTIVAELIDVFLADTPQMLAEIRAALAASAAVVVQRAAHSIKASSASLGAQPLVGACSMLEALARDGHLADGAEHLHQDRDDLRTHQAGLANDPRTGGDAIGLIMCRGSHQAQARSLFMNWTP